jgi:hypothetical protein
MAGYNVRAMLHVLDVKGIRVIANVDDICPLNCPLQRLRKDDELIYISKPLGSGPANRQNPRHNGWAN